MDDKSGRLSLYEEFRQNYPSWRKLAVGYIPYGRKMIQVQIRGGGLILYDGLTGIGKIMREPH